MKIIDKITKKFSINKEYLFLIHKTIIIFIIIDLIKLILITIFKKIKNEKRKYFFTQKTKNIVIIIKIILFILIWLNCLSKIMTLLSFVTAAMTIAIRDIIFNFISGLYIKIKKPFTIEDRIEINEHKGDVININALDFQILEVNNDSFIGQSTGVVVNLPNSSIFNYPLRNYNKGFKYIWNEINVNVPLDFNMEKAKEVLYKVVNKNDIVKEIPNKLKKQIENISNEYRIYYNNYNPIIYTNVNGPYVTYTIRYLVHPKKARYVHSSIWKHILEEYQKGNIEIYK